MSKDTNCQGCAVQQGTHKPAEALSAISEPAQQPDAFQIATSLEESFAYASTQLAADMLRAQHVRIAEMEATHPRELTAYRTTVENLERKVAELEAAPAAQAVEPAAYSGLHNVISWLEGGCDPKHAANELRLIALRAAPAPAAVAVPDGWKLVPVQDTQSMWTAGGRAIKSCAGHERDAASLAYKAMLAAAPALAATPPAQAQAAANTQEKTMPFNSPIYEGVRAAVQRDMHAGAAWHSDTVAVYRFADEMAAKMEQARAKGRGGWETCPPEVLSSMLREHVEKGDPRDVANFCMMLWHLGQPIAPAPQAQDVQRDAAFEAVRKKFCKLQRYSFLLDDKGNVRRVPDFCGNWVEFEAAHTLFDPASVDAAIAAQKGGE